MERSRVTHTPQANEVHETDGRPSPEQRDLNLTRTMVWIGVAGLSAALAFTVVRALISRQPADPTSQRIQQLIDEANQLLKTLDDQRHTG
ncbi:MAG TPA: hypothetical protein VKT72_15375 [Candidatus Baltobacteraceae bacterium]|nr:hypothetical protein [Candidatus Baltobacteraceae bacterium]